LKHYCSPRIEPPSPPPSKPKSWRTVHPPHIGYNPNKLWKKAAPCVMTLPHHLATSNQQQLKQEIMFPEVPQKRREMFYEKFPKKWTHTIFLKLVTPGDHSSKCGTEWKITAFPSLSLQMEPIKWPIWPKQILYIYQKS
jgi:hypothetical protein